MDPLPQLPSSPGDRWCRPGRALALLTVAWALIHLWGIAADALIFEEGRRLWPARSVVEGGHPWLPAIWGRPYLAKPPLYFLTVAGFLEAGAGPELAVRLPAALATLATAWLLLLAGATGGPRPAGVRHGVAGPVAALAWLAASTTYDKASLGELEATLALYLLVSVGCAWRARDGSWAWAGGATLALLAAAFTKGPPAFLLHGAAVLVLLVGHARARRRFGAVTWGPLLLAGAVFVGWALWVRDRPEVRDAVATWQKEVVGRGAGTLRGWALERVQLLVGVLLGWAPATLLLFLARGARVDDAPGATPGRRAGDLDLERFVRAVVLTGLLLLAFTPGVRVRYAYPLSGLCALAAGLAVARVWEGPTAALRERLRLVVWPGIGLLALVLVASTAMAAGWLAPEGVAPGRAALMAGLALAGLLLALRSGRGAPGPALLTLFLAAFAVQFVMAQVVQPGRTDRRGYRASAAVLREAVPEGEVLHAAEWDFFNVLAYLERPVRWLEHPEDAPPGTRVLLLDTHLPALDAARGNPSEVLVRHTIHGDFRVVVVRLD